MSLALSVYSVGWSGTLHPLCGLNSCNCMSLMSSACTPLFEKNVSFKLEASDKISEESSHTTTAQAEIRLLVARSTDALKY